MEEKKDIQTLVTNSENPVTPPTTETTPPVESPKPKLNKKVFMVVGVVLLLALAGGGYFLWQNSQKQTTQPSPTPKSGEVSPTDQISKCLEYIILDERDKNSLLTKRTAEISTSDGTKTIDLNLIKHGGSDDSRVLDDISCSWIEQIILSPDGSYVTLLTWDGGSGVYVVLLGKTSDLSFQEIGLNEITSSRYVVWSADSRYVTTVVLPAGIGPSTIHVWDTQTDNRATFEKPSVNLKDACAYLSFYDPKWINNFSLEVSYEAYYLFTDETCKPSTTQKEKGKTTLVIKQQE